MGAPSLLDAQGRKILSLLNSLIALANSHVVGGIASDGGTTQASGAATAPNIDVDLSQFVDAAVAGTPVEFAGGADVDPDAGDQIAWGATSGKSVIGDLVVKNDGTVQIVFGDVADTGEEEPPATSHFTAILGAGVPWTLIARLTVERTGDTTITIAFDHTKRASLAGAFQALSETEADFANSGFTRQFPITTDPPPA